MVALSYSNTEYSCSYLVLDSHYNFETEGCMGGSLNVRLSRMKPVFQGTEVSSFEYGKERVQNYEVISHTFLTF